MPQGSEYQKESVPKIGTSTTTKKNRTCRKRRSRTSEGRGTVRRCMEQMVVNGVRLERKPTTVALDYANGQMAARRSASASNITPLSKPTKSLSLAGQV